MVNAPLVNDYTNALCRATYLGHKGVVAILLKNGADINIRSSEGRTPLLWCGFRNHTDIAEYLMD